MWTFRFQSKDGMPAFETMTVKELREKLAEYGDDMPVMAEYEGLHTCITAACFTVQAVGYTEEDRCAGVVIEVDG